MNSGLLTVLPPSLWFFAGGLLLFFVPRLLQLCLIFPLPLLALWQVGVVALTHTAPLPVRFLSYDILPLQPHTYSHLFAIAFSLVGFTGGCFAHFARANKQEIALGFLSAGAAIGIVYAGDFLTLFACWEILAISSLFLIWGGGTQAARNAGMRYAIVHLLGGMLLLGGITLHVGATDSLLLPPFHFSPEKLLWTTMTYTTDIAASSLAIWLIFAGVLINAGAPLFSAWIADSYPESSPSGMVFLSAFTTKAAIFILLTFFAGTHLLMYIGLFMLAHGILMAMLENDMRRLLAFAMLAQLGVMLITISIGSPLSEDAAALHAFHHIFYNMLLVMVAGVIMLQTGGKKRFTDLGGLRGPMRFTCFCAVIGALSLAGMPFTGGYIGKSLVSTAIAETGVAWLWYSVTAASALAMVYGSLRFLWFLFFVPATSAEPVQEGRFSLLACLFFATVLVLLPYTATYTKMFHAEYIIPQLQMLTFSAFAFFFFLPLLKPTATISLDSDWLYRRFLVQIVFALEKLLTLGYTAILYTTRHLVQFFTSCVVRLTGPGGLFAETKPLANTTLIVAVLLAGYLLLYHYQN